MILVRARRSTAIQVRDQPLSEPFFASITLFVLVAERPPTL